MTNILRVNRQAATGSPNSNKSKHFEDVAAVLRQTPRNEANLIAALNGAVMHLLDKVEAQFSSRRKDSGIPAMRDEIKKEHQNVESLVGLLKSFVKIRKELVKQEPPTDRQQKAADHQSLSAANESQRIMKLVADKY